MHTHINHGAKNDSHVREPEGRVYSLEHIMLMNEAAGIEKFFVSSFASVLSSEEVVTENEYVASLAERIASLYQWVVIEPRIEETYLQAERMLKNSKCVGIKLHPCCQGWWLSEHYEAIADFASQHSATLLVHPRDADEPYLVRMANEYPSVNIILPHLARVSDVNAYLSGSKNGNFWLDTSGIGSSYNNILEYAISKCGHERILFGTDTYAAGFQRGRIEFAPISDEAKENILRKNAERLFFSR